MIDTKTTQEKIEKKECSKNIKYIKIDCIRPNPYQSRKNYNKISLDDLSESIKQYGVIQPINIRKISDETYELVGGERRLRASLLAGLDEVPAIILDIKEDDLILIGLIENLQREELDYLEEAEGYNNFLIEHGFTQEELARKLGKSQSTIANKIRLLRLSKEIKTILKENGLTERHARALLKLHDDKLQNKVLNFVCDKGLNVKKTEILIDKIIERECNTVTERSNANKFTKAIKDVRIFVNTIRQAIDLMKKSGVEAKAAQFDKGEYMEFVVRIPKEAV